MTDYICTRADKIYKAGIAVAQTPRGVVINVRKPDHPFDVKGVGPVKLGQIERALDVLNKSIEAWPIAPLTIADVRGGLK